MAATETEVQLLTAALLAMLDTALATDDAAWVAGIERAGTSRPCDQAARAIAWVQGCDAADIVSMARVRYSGRSAERTREEMRQRHHREEA